MEIIKAEKQISSRDLEKIVSSLKNDGIIIYPTETVYGIGGNPFSQSALDKIMDLKENRSLDKRFLMLAPDTEVVEKYFVLSSVARELAGKYWPGPLTLVLPLKDERKFSDLIKSNDGYAGVRVSSSSIASSIARSWNDLIVSTSANISGRVECRNLKEVLEEFGDKLSKIDYIIDGGFLSGKPSTVAKVVGDKVIVLRQGEVNL